MSYKSGIIAAKKKIDDRWVIRMDRKEPKDKPASFYIKLLPHEREPIVGEAYKVLVSELIKLPDKDGLDWYEVKAYETKGTTTVVDLEKPKPEVSETAPAELHPESIDQAFHWLSQAAIFCLLKDEAFDPKTTAGMHKMVETAALFLAIGNKMLDGTHKFIDNYFPKDGK